MVCVWNITSCLYRHPHPSAVSRAEGHEHYLRQVAVWWLRYPSRVETPIDPTRRRMHPSRSSPSANTFFDVKYDIQYGTSRAAGTPSRKLIVLCNLAQGHQPSCPIRRPGVSPGAQALVLSEPSEGSFTLSFPLLSSPPPLSPHS